MVKISADNVKRKTNNNDIMMSNIQASMRTHELIQSDPHQVPNTKRKDRQIQKIAKEMYRRQAELATLSQKLDWIYRLGTVSNKLLARGA